MEKYPQFRYEFVYREIYSDLQLFREIVFQWFYATASTSKMWFSQNVTASTNGDFYDTSSKTLNMSYQFS